MNRRIFIRQSAALSAGLSIAGYSCSNPSQNEADSTAADSTGMQSRSSSPIYKISLAEWSLNSLLFNPQIRSMPFDQISGMFENDFEKIVAGAAISNLEFPAKARELGIDGVEYVNQFFYNKAKDTQYLNELKSRCNDEGVESLLIMCDLEGELGHPDQKERMQAVENHYKWVDAAKFLGCHSIRVNASSQGSYEEQQKLAADGLSALAEYAEGEDINVLVENHGGLSSNAEWLSGVMKMVDNKQLGTLPDFGNFCIRREGYTPENPNPECAESYDRYKGVTELMPYAEGVSAKTHDFDDKGKEIHTDYEKMMRIVLDAGYRGYVGIEYEGNGMDAVEGVKATKTLLESVRETLSSEYA